MVGTKGSWAFFIRQERGTAVQSKVDRSGFLGLSTDADHAIGIVFICSISSSPCCLRDAHQPLLPPLLSQELGETCRGKTEDDGLTTSKDSMALALISPCK